MTGVYVRVERDGRYQSLEVDELTDTELDAFFRAMEPDRLRHWSKFFASWIRDHVDRRPR